MSAPLATAQQIVSGYSDDYIDVVVTERFQEDVDDDRVTTSVIDFGAVRGVIARTPYVRDGKVYVEVVQTLSGRKLR